MRETFGLGYELTELTLAIFLKCNRVRKKVQNILFKIGR